MGGSWGPSHQYAPPPGRRLARRRWPWLLVAGYAVWEYRPLVWLVLAVATMVGLAWGLSWWWLRRARAAAGSRDALAGGAEALRERSRRLGGGAYLGVADGEWVCADPEHAVLVLGPPRSGKTSSIVIPSVLAAAGPVVSTATKPDVFEATRRARGEVGQVWLFDPSGERVEWPSGVRRLSWSPVPAASSWDGALVIARAMAAAGSPGKGTSNEGHWRERSTALLAPLLRAAFVKDGQIGDVARWVLRAELDEPRRVLEDGGEQVAADVLAGIAKTDERERSSILSATAGVLSAYNSDSVRRNAAHPNFDVERFVDSCDTVYVTAPAHKQGLCAPLVVGLLEQIRYAVYARAAEGVGRGVLPLFMCLDEVANIAPIHDLPALVSEAGGQGLHVLACLQDLSQARKRWGDAAADGFMSLFQSKVILSGIGDAKTLEAVSVCLGEYDRDVVSRTLAHSQPEHEWRLSEFPGVLRRAPASYSESVAYSTRRQRVLSPGEVARLPAGRALYLQGVNWGLVGLTPWHSVWPWAQIGAGPGTGTILDKGHAGEYRE
ncbi:MAG TPA: type IV secretory system conjugative DNA transfer family protein [Solirubrobacteraceae bacterium]|nr:type IV secretory system conjugative DNA transfer family protein [Solirubrobacteraceae bacterium]